jgi:serine protease Do
MRTPIAVLSFALLPALTAQDPPQSPLESRQPADSAAPLSPAGQAAANVQAGFAEIAARVWPAVVTVRAYSRIDDEAEGAAASGPTDAGWVDGTEPTYPGFHEHAACSGWVVGTDGEFLTCNHALAKPDGSPPDLIDVETHDYHRIVVERVGIEPTVNFAILQAMVWPNSHPKKLPALRFADSDALRSGHWVIGLGDPAGPERFLSVGTFIAQPSRDCYQDLLSAFYMQVGMVAHPEAYGGPLVDMAGEVVGIIAPRQIAPGKWAVSQRLGIEFALPSKIVVGLHEAIRNVRSFHSPWLGFAVMSRPEIAAVRGIDAYQELDKPRNGILIENVFQPSPAFQVGLQPGDWLVAFDETRIFTPVDFQRCLYLAGIGTAVQLDVYRGGSAFRQQLVVEERPAQARPR